MELFYLQVFGLKADYGKEILTKRMLSFSNPSDFLIDNCGYVEKI